MVTTYPKTEAIEIQQPKNSHQNCIRCKLSIRFVFFLFLESHLDWQHWPVLVSCHILLEKWFDHYKQHDAALQVAMKHNHTCLHDWFPDFAGATPSCLPQMWYHMLPVPGRCGRTGSGTEVAKKKQLYIYIYTHIYIYICYIYVDN